MSVLRTHTAAAQLAGQSGAARGCALVAGTLWPLWTRSAAVFLVVFVTVDADVVIVTVAVMISRVIVVLVKHTVGSVEQRLRLASRIFANGGKGTVHLAVCVD